MVTSKAIGIAKATVEAAATVTATRSGERSQAVVALEEGGYSEVFLQANSNHFGFSYLNTSLIGPPGS